MAMRWLLVALFACVLSLALSETHVSKHKHGKHKGTKKHHGKNGHHGKHHHKHHHGKHHHKHHEPEAGAHSVFDVMEAIGKKGLYLDPKGAGAKTTAADLLGKTNDKVEKQPVDKTVTVKMSVAKAPEAAKKVDKEDAIVNKMKVLEAKIAKKKVMKDGSLLVNGPLPTNFQERFARAVALVSGTDRSQVKVKSTKADAHTGIVKVAFTASPHAVEVVEEQAADPDSKLANGDLHSFLVSKDDEDEAPAPAPKKGDDDEESARPPTIKAVSPVEEKGLDIDTAMPYGDLEPFGREDTAQELTEDSISESNSMVDQLEKAEVAEEKRAVFRALTRLRGAAITSFDGVARSQTGNIDEYNKIHQWRQTHPLHHLADEESDVSKWAFPDNADF